ncbi:monovalent cation/H+ antiporter complex subunit F [Isoptericola jiangsuensis]|uniref:monovalent cation/H+ antiporter complex subunit F n=1 Tax=Isoptericola jiangsuensis TaxID=548579 RepID=UPI003AB10591
MIVVLVIAAVLVAVAALLALVRVERGPSMLDRALGVELLASSLVGVIAIEAAWLRRTETIPILVALSLVGFVGSVVIARFVAREPDEDAEVDDRTGYEEDPAADDPGVPPRPDDTAKEDRS